MASIKVRSGLLLWMASVLAVVAVLPYVATIQGDQLLQAAQTTSLSVSTLYAVSVLQAAVLLAIAVALGSWAAQRLGLGAPVIDALAARAPMAGGLQLPIGQAILVGILCGVAILAIDSVFAKLIPALASLAQREPPLWQGFLASFYGGIAEEVFMRWCLLSFIALLLRQLSRALMGATQLLPAPVFWTANLITAVLFGLAHLPATAALIPLTAIVVVRALVLNGIAGVAFGWLFRRAGIEMAMVAHFTADLCIHVSAPALVRAVS